MKQNYYVIATKWNEEYGKQTKYIAGEFTDYTNAKLFCNAYNEHYSTDAIVQNGCDMLAMKN